MAAPPSSKKAKADYGTQPDDGKEGAIAVSAEQDSSSWDGFTVLLIVARRYLPIKELWAGVCKELHATIPRGVRISLRTPQGVALRLLHQQQDAQHPSSLGFFPVSKVRLGLNYGERNGKDLEETMDASVAVALTMLPSTVKEIKFGDTYNGIFDLSVIATEGKVVPQVLIFGSEFNQPLNIPAGVREVRLGRCFNNAITWPRKGSLSKLMFGSCFNNGSLPKLPIGLQVLEFAYDSLFNQPVHLSESVRVVKFGFAFNQTDLQLPPGLEVLHFRGSRSLGAHPGKARFNQPITLPDSLKDLQLGGSFNRPVAIPPGVKRLVLGASFDSRISLSEQLEEIEFGKNYNQPLPPLPAGLKTLILGNAFNQPLPTLPAGLKSLILSDAFNHPFDLPPGLRRVEFGAKFRQNIFFPKALQSAVFGPRYDIEIELDEEEDDQSRWERTIDFHGWQFYDRVPSSKESK